MSRRMRLWLFAAGCSGLAILLGLAARGLPPVGAGRSATGDLIARVSVDERHATDAVAAVTFDYRGFDTMGEEFILYASVVGAALLLRDHSRRQETPDEGPDTHHEPPPPSDAVRVTSLGLVGVTVVFGLYVVAHGHETPGGGFQGGVLLATAPLLAYLATTAEMLPRITPRTLLEVTEAVGAVGYIAAGIAGLVAAGAFMQNVLPLGVPGRLLSAGTIPVLNVTTALAVASGILLLVARFLEKAREEGRSGKGK